MIWKWHGKKKNLGDPVEFVIGEGEKIFGGQIPALCLTWRMKKGLALWLLMGLPAAALIFRDGPSPTMNTETAPTGDLVGSGWQHQVYYMDFHGTVISPKHFVSARHLGGSQEEITRPVFFRGGEEVTFGIKGERVLIGGTDLSVFEIWETFPEYAELYEGGNEAGREMVIHGSGVGRGAAISGRGWKWGLWGTRQSRWGQNIVEGVVTSEGNELLYFGFDDVLGRNEAMATGGDSGGGWFIQDGATWKLAAVSSSVDALYSDASIPIDETGFKGGFYDAVGLWYGNDAEGWEVIPGGGEGEIEFYRQSHSYGSRISSNAPAIRAIIDPAIEWGGKSKMEKFESWLSGFGITAETGVDDDADGDGLSNLNEYLGESHPNDLITAVQPLEVESLSNGFHQFTFVESLDMTERGLVSVLESSPNLLNWEEVTGQVETSNLRDNPKGIRTRVTTIPPSPNGRVFYRLRVTLLRSS